MDKNQWYIVKSGSEVSIRCDAPFVRYLAYGKTVGLSDSNFLWKVWQASPGSDLFL